VDGCATRKMVFHVLRALSQRYKGNAELFGPKVTVMPAITEVRWGANTGWCDTAQTCASP